jgi:AraC-like DNA-binding protein
MLEEGMRRGYPREALLATMGPSARLLSNPEARVPLDAYYALVEDVAARTRDPWFGATYAATRRSVDGLDAVGFLALSSATLGDAVARVVRFQAFLRSGERFELDIQGDDAIFRFRAWGPARPAHAHVAMIAAYDYLSFPRLLIGSATRPRFCRFSSPVAGPTHEIAAIFGVRPEVGCAENEFALPREALALPMPRPDAALARFFEEYLERRTPEDAPSLRAQVERHLGERLAEGDLSLRATARALSLSTRTLQRRLALEASTYDGVVDDLRRRRALVLLRAGVVRHEVAYLVGYEDPSAFARAVRRWSGLTPKAWADATRG